MTTIIKSSLSVKQKDFTEFLQGYIEMQLLNSRSTTIVFFQLHL